MAKGQEKLSDKAKCILCRKNIRRVKQQPFKWKQSKVFDSWDEQCATTLCQILFKSHPPDIITILNEGGYCSGCKQKMWDLDYAYQTIQKLKNQISKLVQTIVHDFTINYANVPVTKKTKEKISSVLMYDQCVSIIYKELEKVGLLSKTFSVGESTLLDFKESPLLSKNPLACNQVSEDNIQSEIKEENPDSENDFFDELNVNDFVFSPNSPNVQPLELPSISMSNESTKVKQDSDKDEDYHPSDTSENDEPRHKKKRQSTLSKNNIVDDKSTRKKRCTIKDKKISNEDSPAVLPNPEMDDHQKLEKTDESKNRKDKDNDDEYQPPPETSEKSDSEEEYDEQDKELEDNKKKRRHKKSAPPTLTTLESEPPTKPKYKQKRRSVAEYHAAKPITCTMEGCIKRFSNDLMMYGHYAGYHLSDKKPYKCTQCLHKLVQFQSAYKYIEHVKCVHEGLKRKNYHNPSQCSDCGKMYQTKSKLKLHAFSCSATKDSDFHDCKVCSKRFKTLEEVQTHTTSIHQGINPYTCEDCEKIFTNSVSLRNHIKTVHPTSDRAICSICAKSFMSQAHLEHHENLNHPELRGKTYMCKYCGQVCKNYYTLSFHRRTKHADIVGPSTFTCKECNAVFNSHQGLIFHKRKHTGVKPFECKICGKVFRVLKDQKIHEEIHSGVKHTCHICGESKSTKNVLKKHLLTVHSNSKDDKNGNKKSKSNSNKGMIKNKSLAQEDDSSEDEEDNPEASVSSIRSSEDEDEEED